METITLDCTSCARAGLACHDCVVSVLLGPAGAEDEPAVLTAEEQRAVAVLSDGGLLPPLRLLEALPQPRIVDVEAGDAWPVNG